MHIEDEADDDIRSGLKTFLLEHTGRTMKLMKRIHAEPMRTVIKDKDVYPEKAMGHSCVCTAMANRPLGEIGSILSPQGIQISPGCTSD